MFSGLGHILHFQWVSFLPAGISTCVHLHHNYKPDSDMHCPQCHCLTKGVSVKASCRSVAKFERRPCFENPRSCAINQIEALILSGIPASCIVPFFPFCDQASSSLKPITWFLWSTAFSTWGADSGCTHKLEPIGAYRAECHVLLAGKSNLDPQSAVDAGETANGKGPNKFPTEVKCLWQVKKANNTTTFQNLTSGDPKQTATVYLPVSQTIQYSVSCTCFFFNHACHIFSKGSVFKHTDPSTASQIPKKKPHNLRAFKKLKGCRSSLLCQTKGHPGKFDGQWP